MKKKKFIALATMRLIHMTVILVQSNENIGSNWCSPICFFFFFFFALRLKVCTEATSNSITFMDEIVVSKDGVTKLLKGLNTSKALGPDELHHRVLKELATVRSSVFFFSFFFVVVVFFFLFFCFFIFFSNQLTLVKSQIANICPLFKKSDRSLACNYRPISLTCAPCKLLEHIVCTNIMAHLDEYKLLSNRQHT